MSATTGGPVLAHETLGAGTPVVFLHGLTFNRGMWRPVMERLGDSVQSIAFDLPGHGASPGQPPYHLGDVADAIAQSLDALEVERPVLVGHSISAVIALRYAAAHPVRGVVDVDQPLNPAGFVGLLQRIEPTLREADFHIAFQPFQQNMGFDRLDTVTRQDILTTQKVDRDLVLGYWDELFSTDPAAARAHNETLMASLDGPFLGFFSHDLQPPERAFLLDHLRDVELEEWPGLGHFIHLVQPDRFAARLSEFVTRHQ
ncbi:MAG TPA: alpha/beta hydrolase [Conexibacter sp.]|jgi:pimeloyl-ACP methyl ester carboxylesterase